MSCVKIRLYTFWFIIMIYQMVISFIQYGIVRGGFIVKVFLKIILTIFLVLALIVGSGLFWITRGLDSGSKLTVRSVDLSALNTGDYTGKYKSGRFSNEIKVTVKDHKITKIDILKDVTFAKPEWTKELFDKIIKEQKIDVDVVSGATITSKAYLESIEAALQK